MRSPRERCPPLDRLRACLTRAGYHSRPSFLIIGAQKAGTTALFQYLAQHPGLAAPRRKELAYFSGGTTDSRGPGTRAAGHCVDAAPSRATHWYHAQFPLPHRLLGGRETFEATPEYLYDPAAPARIRAYEPGMKLLVLLRDPVERAYSAWNMFRAFAGEARHAHLREDRDFLSAVREELVAVGYPGAAAEPSYVRRGFYHDQLVRYFRHFPTGQLMVVDSRQLRSRTAGTLAEVSQFLGLRRHDWGRVPADPVHARGYAAPMPEPARVLLREVYRPHNARLYELLGHDFGWA
jgi:hypothetical protein